MTSNGQPDQTAKDSALAAEKPACFALVPVVPTIHWSHVPDQQISRADFVTQLIATAEYAPQTRSLRRATPAVAQAAYGAQKHPAHRAGSRTRQII